MAVGYFVMDMIFYNIKGSWLPQIIDIYISFRLAMP